MADAITDDTRLYELTNYPKIFRSTYWGNFNARKNPTHSEIFENRNKLVNQFLIDKCVSKKYPKRIKMQIGIKDTPLYDHEEVYLDNCKNYVIVVSPYENGQEEYTRGWFEGKGFVKYDRLYSSSAWSFVWSERKNKMNLKSSSTLL
jgi:hypothetical protein